MAIHELTTATMQCLDRLAPEVFDNAIDPVRLARFLGDPRHLMLVAIEDDLVVGAASAVEYFHPDKPKRASKFPPVDNGLFGRSGGI